MGLETPLGVIWPLCLLWATIYPLGLHISLEDPQFVVCNAPSHHDLRAIIVLFMPMLGQGRDSIRGVLHIHIHQQGTGNLVIEALKGYGVWPQSRAP